MHAVEAKTGKVIFDVPNISYDDMMLTVHKLFSAGTILSSPVVGGHTMLWGSTDGNLYAPQ